MLLFGSLPRQHPLLPGPGQTFDEQEQKHEHGDKSADGEAGDSARGALPRAVRMSHERLCTVSRTVEAGTPIATTVA